MDELRDAVASAYEQDTPSAPAAPETPAPKEDVPATPEATPPADKPEDKPAGEAPPATTSVAPPVEAPTGPDKSRVDRAPTSWRGEAKTVWAALPLQVRQEVVRRERDMERSLQEHAQVRNTLEVINQTVAPYVDIIQRNYGGSPAKAVQSLFEVERVLTTAPTAQKAQFVANLIKHYGVDIQALDGFLAGQAAPEHQQTLQFQQLLDQRLAPLMNFVQQQQQHQQQYQQNLDYQAELTVEQMAADPTNFPYLNEVKLDMADLIDMSAKRGLYLTLPEAYNKAVRMNDLTFEATTAQLAQGLATQAQQQADAAKAASSSVSGTPVPQPVTPPNPADLHALLSANYDNAVGGRL